MRALRKDLSVKAVELRQQQSGMTDGVHSDVPATSMRGVACDFDLHPDEAAMRRHDRKLRWFRDDGCVGPNAPLPLARSQYDTANVRSVTQWLPPPQPCSSTIVGRPRSDVHHRAYEVRFSGTRRCSSRAAGTNGS